MLIDLISELYTPGTILLGFYRISFLAYSPLAMGILSGKYLSPDKGPTNARLNLFKGRYSEGESRYNLSKTIIKEATKAYVAIAEKYDINPVSLAIEPCSMSK
ncbi:hypothetical protein AgCh_006127 [Apium graveolens]